ncbi:MAG: hypothetical protein ACLRMW_12580 [[Clostridium] symbiosum]
MQVKSTVKMNFPRIKQLTQAAVTALEMTGEALHTEVVQAQVFPFDTGNLQNESTFVDYSKAKDGKVTLISSTPYARRLYYHPEYNFQTKENPNAKGHWYEDWESDGSRANFAPNAFKQFYKKVGGV